MTRQGKSMRNVVVAVAAMLLLALSALAQDPEIVLHTFTGGKDGAVGGNHLVSDSAGNLYGTTFGGGNKSTSCEVYTGLVGCGVVFKLTPTGKETVLHAFSGGKDGGAPVGGVVLDSAGNLYGTTLFGGNKMPAVCHAVANFAAGCGVVYKLTPTTHGHWTETVLYTFTGGADGSEPWGNLIFDSAGNLYGTATIGGNDSCQSPYGCGVVFELTLGVGGVWTESVLYTFNAGGDGGVPYGGLTFDTQGNLYGTAYVGGDTSVKCAGVPGCGVVFQLAPTPSGPWTETVLHAFTGAPDGAFPLGGVTLDSAGNVYGSTINGGDTTRYYCHHENPGCGIVFELTQGTWEETVVHTFTDGKDGALGYTPVILDSAGNLYSVADVGGKRVPSCAYNQGCGVVFKMTPAEQGPWTESVLYSFTGGTDGRVPYTNLLFDSAGSLYGMTNYGGDNSCNPPYGCGVVFQVQQPQNATSKERLWDSVR
jgi:uncharacterized repeat protein (TIGR03803 family)